MVAATPTPGYSCSGRLWVTRCERDYLWSARTCHLVPKRGHVRALQSLDNARRAETQNLRLTPPLLRVRASEKL
jgi:hypothetical protein